MLPEGVSLPSQVLMAVTLSGQLRIIASFYLFGNTLHRKAVESSSGGKLGQQPEKIKFIHVIPVRYTVNKHRRFVSLGLKNYLEEKFQSE